MRLRHPRPLNGAAIAVAVVAVLSGCGGGSSDTSAGGGQTLAGLFQIVKGSCAGHTPAGSWFRMVQSGGTPAKGPYVRNPDSTCRDATVTPLSSGTAGGLVTGGYQPEPKKPFAAHGVARAAAIVKPQPFFAVAFGVSTNPHDPQTSKSVAAPTVTVDGTKLTGNLAAWSVSWNGQQFNQGAPKPDGSGSTATGTYDPATHHYTLDWTSRIVGGPFNNFTGVWHLEGTVQNTK
jgi:hypothetical protein